MTRRLSSGWFRTTTAHLIQEGALEIGDGYRAKNAEFEDSGVPFLRIGNIGTNGQFELADAPLFPVEDLSKVGRKLSRPGDCVIATKATIGRSGFVRADTPRLVYSPQVSYWRVLDGTKLSPTFLRYWLQSKEFIGQATGMKGSTAMADYINLRDQRQMTITLPPPLVQERVGATLAAFDELIENNLRRIETLEELAHAIYREWFVDLRFPSHVKATFVDSAIGPIPDTWELTALAGVAEARRGLSWDRAQERTDSQGTGILTIPNLQRRLDTVPSTHLDVPPGDIQRFSLSRGDTLMVGSNGNPQRVGQAAWVPSRVNSLFASFLMRIRPAPDRISPYLLFHQLRDPRVTDPLRAGAIGSTGLRNIRITALRELLVLLPTHEIQTKFDEHVRPLFDLIEHLDALNRNLHATRELLLPKLISGEIDLSNLSIDTSWLAA